MGNHFHPSGLGVGCLVTVAFRVIYTHGWTNKPAGSMTATGGATSPAGNARSRENMRNQPAVLCFSHQLNPLGIPCVAHVVDYGAGQKMMYQRRR